MSDLSPSQVNSRVNLLERPFISPGKCIMCGAVDRPVVDFGANIRNYGAVMFCTTCITELGSAVGLVPESLVINTEKAVGVIVSDFLAAHNLMAVSSEYIINLGDSLNNLSAGFVSSMYDFSVQDTEDVSDDSVGNASSDTEERSDSDSSSSGSKQPSSGSTQDSSKYSVVQGSSSVSDSGSLADIPDLS